jgi:co-chaperonin GroES (HSP10)
MNVVVKNDRVLVLLPPNDGDRRTLSGLFTPESLPSPVTFGRVVRTGPKVRDLRPGDAVAFPATAGDAWPYGDHLCLFLRESECVARIAKADAKGSV